MNDLLMPVLTLLTGGVNVSNLFIPLKEMDPAIKTLEAAKEAGISTLNYGMFIQAIIDFLLIAFGIFLFVKLIAKMKKGRSRPRPEARKCPFCFEAVADDATRCPHCTSDISGK